MNDLPRCLEPTLWIHTGSVLQTCTGLKSYGQVWLDVPSSNWNLQVHPSSKEESHPLNDVSCAIDLLDCQRAHVCPHQPCRTLLKLRHSRLCHPLYKAIGVFMTSCCITWSLISEAAGDHVITPRFFTELWKIYGKPWLVAFNHGGFQFRFVPWITSRRLVSA